MLENSSKQLLHCTKITSPAAHAKRNNEYQDAADVAQQQVQWLSSHSQDLLLISFYLWHVRLSITFLGKWTQAEHYSKAWALVVPFLDAVVNCLHATSCHFSKACTLVVPFQMLSLTACMPVELLFVCSL